MRVKPDVTASLWGCSLGEQLSAGRGELHIGSRFMPRQPAFVDCPLDTGAELLGHRKQVRPAYGTLPTMSEIAI
jgi:hypothetical protein